VLTLATLTKPQEDVLMFIMQEIEQEGRPPTLAEIARACGFAGASGADCHIKPLVRKLYIRRTPSRACGIKPLDAAKVWFAQKKQENTEYVDPGEVG
jgi:repressor LexA